MQYFKYCHSSSFSFSNCSQAVLLPIHEHSSLKLQSWPAPHCRFDLQSSSRYELCLLSNIFKLTYSIFVQLIQVDINVSSCGNALGHLSSKLSSITNLVNTSLAGCYRLQLLCKLSTLCKALMTHDPSLTGSKTLESDSFICVRQKPSEDAQPEVIIINLKNNNEIVRRPIKADSAIMHWHKQIIALKAQRTLQIFDLGQKQKIKSFNMNEDVLYWKWVSVDTLGLVTETAVFHWNIYDSNQAAPQKMFERTPNLSVSTLSMSFSKN